MNPVRVLVTGASGFVGGHIARDLRGLGAVGASRVPQSDATITWQVPFDPADAMASRRALDGAEVVVHAAGRAHVLRETEADPLEAFRAANVESTRTLVDAARAAGVRRFILLSSVSVYGESASGTITAETPTVPTTPYGVSRLESEAVVRAAEGIETVILRLPMVYGPGMKGNPLRLFDLVARGIPLPLGSIANARSMIYVGNVVAAVRGLLSAPVERGRVLLAADAEPVSTPGLVREIAAALGRPARLFPVPRTTLHYLSRLGVAVLGSRFPLGPDALWRLESSLVVDARPLEGVLGAPPPFSRIDGLRATARWHLSSR